MLMGKKIVVVLPAYHAAKTLCATIAGSTICFWPFDSSASMITRSASRLRIAPSRAPAGDRDRPEAGGEERARRSISGTANAQPLP